MIQQSFPGPFFSGGSHNSGWLSDLRWPNCTKFEEDIDSYRCLTMCSRFQLCCTVSIRRWLDGNLGRKSTPDFALFLSQKKCGRNGLNILSQIFVPNLEPTSGMLLTVGCSAVWRLEVPLRNHNCKIYCRSFDKRRAA